MVPGLAGRRPVVALLSVVGTGVTSPVLGVALQTRLMDPARTAPSLGAALCHSASDAADPSGAALVGVGIAAGRGHLAPPWVGLGPTLVGFALVLAAGRRPVPPGPEQAPVIAPR